MWFKDVKGTGSAVRRCLSRQETAKGRRVTKGGYSGSRHNALDRNRSAPFLLLAACSSKARPRVACRRTAAIFWLLCPHTRYGDSLHIHPLHPCEEGKGANSASTPEERFDFLLAFCQNCHALRDWFEKDGAVSKDQLDALMQSNQPLRVCRDIANGSKHLKVDRPSVDQNFSIGREYCGPEIPDRWFVIVGDDLVDTLALASQCVDAWRMFLQDHGLMVESLRRL